MKRIKYQVVAHLWEYDPVTDSIEKRETLVSVMVGHSRANEEIAKRDAYNGEYIIEDEADTASTDDVLDALLGV